jgi:hypothetical protein
MCPCTPFDGKQSGCFLFCLALFTGIYCEAAPPVRLAVDSDTKSIQLGQTASVTIGLRDAYNNNATARKDYRVMLQVSLGNAPTSQQTVWIRVGQQSVLAGVRPPQPGIFLVKASHPELREDAIYIQVRRPKAGGSARLAFPVWESGRPVPKALVEQTQSPSRATSPSPVELKVTNSIVGSKPTANGKDAVKIQAFLSEEAPVDLTLRLSCSAGQLLPRPFVIPKGSDYGEIFLTSQTPGIVHVGFVDAKPPNLVKVIEGGDSDVNFDQALTFHLVASPPTIPLGHSADLQIEFWDLQKVARTLDETRKADFNILYGLGDFNPNPVTIEKGQSSGRTTFTPEKAAHMQITATTYGVSMDEPVQLNVANPVEALVAAGIGGVIGGLLAGIWRKQTARRSLAFRCGSGAVVALVMTLACQQGLLPAIPTATVLNPLWIQVIAIPSGWGGVELLDVILRVFGLLPAR